MRRFLHRHQPPGCGGCWLKAGIGAMLGIGFIALLGEHSGVALLIAPFGASCVLLFAVPESPFSQPANVIGGHVLATTIAVALDQVLPDTALSMALAVGVVIAVMHLARLTHPPAGADPLIVMQVHPGFDFVLMPVLVGAVVLVAVAFLIHRLPPARPYPLPHPEIAERTQEG